MCSRCDDTVLRLMVRAAAICGFDDPREQHEHVDLAARQPGRQRGSARDAVARSGEHGRDRVAVEAPLLHLGAHGGDRRVAVERGPVRAGLAQRVVDVGRGEQPGVHRERGAREPVRVAAAVEAFVVLRRAGDDRCERPDPGEHPSGEVGVRARPFLLREGPGVRRVPHRARDADHADVVDRAGATQARGVGRGETRRQRGFTDELGNAARMADAELRLEVGEVAERRERGVELRGRQLLTQPRIEVDHLVPRLERIQPREDRVAVRAEAVDELRIELCRASCRRHVDSRVCPARVVEGLDAVGEVDETDRRRELRVADASRNALAVPSFERLQERGAHVVAQLQLTGELARRLAVRLHHLLHRATSRREELADHADAPHPRAAVAEVASDEHRHRHPGEVVVVRVGVEGRLVAEQLGQFARVGRARDPREERGVVGGRAHLGRDAGRVGEPHRDDGLAQHPLHRTAHAEVGDERERRNQL